MINPITLLILCALLPAGTARAQSASPTETPVSAKARAIQESAIVVDTHADTPQRFLDENFDIGSTDPKDAGHISLDKVGRGNLGAEFFSIWVEPETNKGHFAQHTLDLIDSVYQQAAHHPDRMMMAFSVGDIERAHNLAQWLVEIALRFGRRATAFVTDMNQPLGRSIGTGLEVIEARDFLRGSDVDGRALALILRIVAALLEHADVHGGEAAAQRALHSGAGYEKFIEMVEAQGGSRNALEALTPPRETRTIVASRAGIVHAIDVARLGNAGRALASADSLAGLRIAVRIGDAVAGGAPLLHVYGSDRDACDGLVSAFTIEDARVEPPPLVYDRIDRSTSATR